MKKIFMILSISMIFIFIFNNSKASATSFANEYGVNMTYKTLYFEYITDSSFNFTGTWWDATATTFAFEYQAVEESLEEFIRLLEMKISNFMKLYFIASSTIPYLNNTNSIPPNNIGWTQEDGYIYLIIDKDYIRDTYFHYFDNPNYTTEQATILALYDIAESIRVDTWVVTETTPDYQVGYNTGYQHGYNNGHAIGYNRGFNDGEVSKQNEIDAILPGLLQDEYERGYDDGLMVAEGEAYDRGYIDGANESFIATMDKWLVPAIIIVMLIGGFFAIARKKHEGDI